MGTTLPKTPAATSAPSMNGSTHSVVHDDEALSELGLEGNLELSKTLSAIQCSLPTWRKCLIVFSTSWMTLSATFSSTSLFSASNEIAIDFSSRTSVVNISNAGALLAMAFSSFIWIPIQSILGRQVSYTLCSLVLLLLTAGAALAPDLPVFIALRVLSGLQGTYFHVAGQAVLAQYFTPTQRGTATGFFLCGTILGPPLGPCVAGIIVSFAHWRIILWVQVAMLGLGTVFSLLFIPYDKHIDRPKYGDATLVEKMRCFNPLNVLRLLLYPNILFTDLACGLLSWSQYSLLAAPRHILSSRFGLTSPLISGLFYLAPAGGFLLGTLVGGRYSDLTVIKWIDRRNGQRLPQDRLNSGMLSFFLLTPAAFLLYGWGIEYSVGGLALPIVTAFFAAAGLLAAFASLNTYSAEVLSGKRLEVVASKYLVQYMFAASSSAVTLPLMEKTGVGSACTIGVVMILIGGLLTWTTARYGLMMQRWREGLSIHSQ